MSDSWVIELIEGGARHVIENASLRVDAGHLLAERYGRDLVAAWTPGSWSRFWEKPSDRAVASAHDQLAAIDALLDTDPRETVRHGLLWMRFQAQQDLEQMVAMLPEPLTEQLLERGRTTLQTDITQPQT